MRHLLLFVYLLACAALAPGCTDDPSPASASPARDAGEDVFLGEDSGADAGLDDTVDAGGDMGGEAGIDVAPDAGPLPTGESCDEAIDVTAGGVWAMQTTIGGGDVMDSSVEAEGCPSGAASGPERIYVVRPLASTSYEVKVTPEDPSYDPLLYVKASCDELAACVAGTVLNGPGEAETVSFTAEPGQALFIIVDGELVSEGSFTLEVTPN